MPGRSRVPGDPVTSRTMPFVQPRRPCPLGDDHCCAAASRPVPCATSMSIGRRSSPGSGPGLSLAA